LLRFKCSPASIEQLTENEIDKICLGEPCNYTHKVNFDNHIVKVSNPDFLSRKEIWVFYEVTEQKKVYKDHTSFLFLYLVFDFFAILSVLTIFFYFKKEKAKQNRQESRIFNEISKKKEAEPSNASKEEEKPLPRFGTVFFFGYLQFFICLIVICFMIKFLHGK